MQERFPDVPASIEYPLEQVGFGLSRPLAARHLVSPLTTSGGYRFYSLTLIL